MNDKERCAIIAGLRLLQLLVEKRLLLDGGGDDLYYIEQIYEERGALDDGQIEDLIVSINERGN